ncbi:hypothetical protein SLA2020_206060 [Shorea laevis]
MEPSQHGFLEELLAPRRDRWTTFATGCQSWIHPTPGMTLHFNLKKTNRQWWIMKSLVSSAVIIITIWKREVVTAMFRWSKSTNSIPKISKMDRTSILGDTTDYMKELLERIIKQQQEVTKLGSYQMNLVGILRKELKPDEVMVRNTAKFDVERREKDTTVDICCAAKPGFLLSTVSKLKHYSENAGYEGRCL